MFFDSKLQFFSTLKIYNEQLLLQEVSILHKIEREGERVENTTRNREKVEKLHARFEYEKEKNVQPKTPQTMIYTMVYVYYNICIFYTI